MFDITKHITENNDALSEAFDPRQGQLDLGRGSVDYKKKVQQASSQRARRFGSYHYAEHTILGMVLGHQNLSKAWTAASSRLHKKFMALQPPGGNDDPNRQAFFDKKHAESGRQRDQIDDKFFKLTAEKLVQQLTPEEVKYTLDVMDVTTRFKALVKRLRK